MCDVKDEFNVFFEKKHLCSSLVFDWGEKANICANINEMFHSAFAFNERMQEHSRSFFYLFACYQLVFGHFLYKWNNQSHKVFPHHKTLSI